MRVGLTNRLKLDKCNGCRIVTIQVSVRLHEKLQTLADMGHTDPVGVIEKLVASVDQQRGWLRDLSALQQQVQADGGLATDKTTRDEIIAQLRQTRQELFETEYTHLYR